MTRCRWVDDKCQHSGFIDDPETEWDPETRHYACPREKRSE